MTPERVGVADERGVAGLSRRQLLGAMTAVGAAGGFVGVSTGASLFDTERFDGSIVAGVVDLVVASSVDGTGERFADGDRFTLDLGELEPGEEGHVDLRLFLPATDTGAAPNNPAYPWFRPSCIDASGTLVDDLRVTLRYADCATGDPGAVVAPWSSLRQFVESFREGFALDGRSRPNRTPGNQACLDDPVCLRLDYSLDDDFVGKGDTRVDLDFVGIQCRNRTGEENPFAGRPGRRCDEPPREEPPYHAISYIQVYADRDGDGDCDLIGKLELGEEYTSNCGADLDVAGNNDTEPIGENYIVEGTYDLPVDDDCEDTGYDLHVTETVTKTEAGKTEVVGVAFELLNDDGSAGPDLCKVVIKGGKVGKGGVPSGKGTVTYTEPSYFPGEDTNGPHFDGNATNGPLFAQEEGR